MVGTKHQTTSVSRNLCLVESAFQGDDILACHLLAARSVSLTRSGDYRGGFRIAVRGQRMDGLLVLGRVNGIAVALYIGGELVIGNGIQLVVRHAGRLRLVFVQADGNITFRKILDRNRIGGIVYQHIRITSHIHQMDDVSTLGILK